MATAGFGKEEAVKIKDEVQYYEDKKTVIKLASSDHIDLKAYEPAMRHLIDTYIDAEESEKISAFDDQTIVDLIVKKGIGAVDNLPNSITRDKKAVSEVIENNVRRLIVEENPTNPKYYEKMSVLLAEIIRLRKENSITYANYLKKMSHLIQNLKNPSSRSSYPKDINSDSKRALYDNLDNMEEIAMKVDEAIRDNKPDGWRGNKIKERTVRLAIQKALEECSIYDDNKVEYVLTLARNQDEY
jgi:type I restriction enzyme R subunit